jgi:hypothetical protein
MTTLDKVYLDEDPQPHSEIAPGLWMGGTPRHETIGVVQPMLGYSPDRPFDAVLTLYAWAAPASWGVEERRFGFPDRHVIEEYVPVIHDLADWAHERWSSGRRVLIRCAGGMNRSGLLVALTLVRAGYSPSKAIELIRERRHPWALNNHSFVGLVHSSATFGGAHE